MRKLIRGGLAVAACMTLGTAVFAAVLYDFDPISGTGFVGKGDVQNVFEWNNKDLQAGAEFVQFRSASTIVTEVSWICTNTNNENIQEREQTTTTVTEGVVDSVARERNQVTGFILTGFDGSFESSDPTTEGPPVNSCPSGPWTLTTPAGDPEVVEISGGLQVSLDGETWFPLD